MYRNRKTAAILVVAAGLVLALIFAVGHSLAANGKPSSDQTPTASDGSSANAGNGSAGNGSAGNGTDLLLRGGQGSRPSQSSGASGSGRTANGTSGTDGSTTTTPPTTTPPGGGGHRPPFHPPVNEVGGTFGVSDPGTPPTTTPPNHNPVSDPGGCVHKQGFFCP
jgi:hypothetical protein